MKLKIAILLLVLAVISIAADSYPISDWRVLWQFPDAKNCGTYIDEGIEKPNIKITWIREIMIYGEIWGWHKSAETMYTCTAISALSMDYTYLPLILNK